MYELYLVTDETLSLGRPLEEIIRQAVDGGVTMVQLREKYISTRQFIERALNIKKILQEKHVPLIINDRVDVALAVEADGVHLGQNDMPVGYARKILPRKAIIGLSVETIEQAEEAESLDVDYLGVSPVFSTPTKTDIHSEWGLEGLKELSKKTHHKLVAIGGIKAQNAADIIQAGADGIAVVSDICSAREPDKAAKELISIVKRNQL